ncbi:c-type cytochrome [Candidatus Sumerlaeota bacterium]|nr:c-type cytochrome [Candidatus Sumerlaeota bacterium]
MKRRGMTRQGVFNFWSVLLALSAVWAVFQDFNPKWKKYQKEFAALTLDRARSQIELENQKVRERYGRRLEEVDARILELRDANRSVNHQEVIASMELVVDDLMLTEQVEGQALSFAKSELGSARYYYEFLSNDARASAGAVAKAKAEYTRLFDEVQELTPVADLSYANLTQGQERLKELQKGPADLVREKEAIFKEMMAWEDEVDRINPNDIIRFTANIARDIPLADFVDPKYNIKQVVMEGLPDITKSAKVDRCTTCHLGIADPNYEGEDFVIQVRLRGMGVEPGGAIEEVAAGEHEAVAGGEASATESPGHGIVLGGEPEGGSLDFGERHAHGAAGASLEVVIRNEGESIRYFIDGGFSITGEGADSFSIVNEPSTTALSPGASRTISIDFEPSTLGDQTAALSIATSDIPQPYRVHPALDLFVGSRSPHPMGKFGCTSCHLGRGYGTTFKLAAHTPNNEAQEREWRKDRAWKDLHYWDYPMLPKRNQEAMCISCHKTTQGYELTMARDIYEGRQIFERRGCHGCHKVEGFSDDMNKIGPSLRKIASKLNQEWVPRWVSGPREFYDSARMPHPFGHKIPSKENFPEFMKHIEHDYGEGHFDELLDQMTQDESVIIEGIVTYLFAESEEFAMDEPPREEGDAQRGRELIGGILDGDRAGGVNCLGCHKLDAHGSTGNGFAPDLSKIGSKLDPDKGRKWLYNWLRDPKKYWPDGNMPNPRLTDEEANDITAYLMTLKDDSFLDGDPPDVTNEEVDEMAVRYFRAKMSESEAHSELNDLVDLEFYRYKLSKTVGAAEGVRAGRLSSRERTLHSIGKEAIYRFGCFGCHDIGGFEERQKIGAELTAEGFKELERFDFGMHNYVHLPHTRVDWIEQKVKQPYIYFLGKVLNPYEQTLQMPWFDFDDEDAAKITTFILGQTGVTPPASYRYEPRGDQAAILEGRKIIERRNCIGCHKIGLGEQWIQAKDFDFSRSDDVVWSIHNLVAKHDPNLPADTYLEVIQTPEPGEDDRILLPAEGFILSTSFITFGEDYYGLDELFAEKPIEIDVTGEGEVSVELETPAVLRLNGIGEGYIGRFYEESALAPPILRWEGRKVRPQWFFNFLKNVEQIRYHIDPLRMPQWEWTDEEANAVVLFFAASAGVTYPFESEEVAPLSDVHRETARELFGLPGSEEYSRSLTCISCHPTGDFLPTLPKASWGPDLFKVQERLRVSFVRSWLKNPPSWMPNTRMPNFFYSEDTVGNLDAQPSAPVIDKFGVDESIHRLAEMLYHMPQIEEVRLAAAAAAETQKQAAAEQVDVEFVEDEDDPFAEEEDVFFEEDEDEFFEEEEDIFEDDEPADFDESDQEEEGSSDPPD